MWPNEPDPSYLAYAIGYSDGIYKGVYSNPYEDSLSHFYKLGYDSGIADYCAIEHPNEDCNCGGGDCAPCSGFAG